MLRLAWRNVWRNRRRTAITVSSIGAGLAALFFGQSLVTTIQYQLIEKATGVYVGQLQVVGRGVDDYKFPNIWIEDPASVERAIEAVPGVAAFESRIVATGLASSKTESAGILVLGVEPEREREVMTMHTYLAEGKFLGDEEDGIYLGKKMAAQLGVGLGGEVVIMSSAVDGSMGAELFTVVGIFDSGSHTFDASIAYVRIEAVQRLLSVYDEVNNFVLKLEDQTRMREVQAALTKAIGRDELEVVTWEEVDPELVGIRDYQDALLSIILVVIFLIVALGILNTLLMAMFERIREFGVLMAVGARPSTIRLLVLAESMFLGGLGALLGSALGAGLILHFGASGLELPIGDAVGFFMPFDSVLYLRFDWARHAYALAAVFATCVLSGLSPAIKASRLKPVEALRHV
jgi:ABC-type lipoprotein release transport system permease subunit